MTRISQDSFIIQSIIADKYGGDESRQKAPIDISLIGAFLAF
jgi:hypothetical protein